MLRILVAISVVLFPLSAIGSDPQLLKKKSSWNWPDHQSLVQKVYSFLETRLTGSDLNQAKQSVSNENTSVGVGLLDTILATAAKGEPSIEAMKILLDSPFTADSNAKIEAQISSILANGSIPAWLKTDLQLICGRYQVHHALFDEALQRLQPLSQEASSDPATWLFCMAVCQHHLMQRAACLETIDKLLERETELPSRYAITARLMQSDIKPLKEDSLDEIARLMNDVERRLALGRTGKTVREKEQAIVDKLDKMIDKLEQQQQEQQKKQQQKNGGGSQGQKPQQGSQGMDESQIAGTKGPGDVDQKDIGEGSGWGNLPSAQQRLEAVQNITKDLPSHYREVIEAYFKRLATSQPK
jgi:hypothetical protein